MRGQELGVCVDACRKVGCAEGEFCDPATDRCKTKCPYPCKAPESGTPICEPECGYACHPDYNACKGECRPKDDITACGPQCEVCAAREDAEVRCDDEKCVYDCKESDRYDAGTACEPCEVPEHCGDNCDRCSARPNASAVCSFKVFEKRCEKGGRVTNANGPEQCRGFVCSDHCNPGTYDAGKVCRLCNVAEHCGETCKDCTAKGTLTSAYCGPKGTCVKGKRVERGEGAPGQPLVEDRQTALVWQGCAAGLVGDRCDGETTGKASKMSWQEAKVYCEQTLNGKKWGGHETGWRMPTRDELESLLNWSRDATPHIDVAVFPNTPADYFWSSSATDPLRQDTAWNVSFGYGPPSFSGKEGPHYVRCVRGKTWSVL